MAKRFTDTGKWKKKWIRQLDPKYKLFWFYLLDNCDHAGIFDADIESASFHIGLEYKEKEILETFDRKIIVIKKDKWFIPKFVEYQYGILNEANRAHASVIKLLEKYKLNGPKLGPTVGDKDKYKEKVKVKDKKTKKQQLLTIKESLEDYREKFPLLNIDFYFENFVDYLDSSGKRYKNYKSAFTSACRLQWYKDRPGSLKSEEPKSNKVFKKCPDGHGGREMDKNTFATCPKCRTTLKTETEITFEKITGLHQ